MLDMLEFLRDEGVSADITAEIEKFRDAYPEEDETLRRRVPDPRYLYYGKDIWEEAITAILCGENLLLVGPKATGKNVLAENLATVFGRPSWNVSFYINTDAATLLGTDTFENGAVQLRKGPIYQCAETGGFGVLDEINMAKNESLAVLHATLDFRRSIDMPGYERIPLHDATRFIATMNYGYAGTRELNEALASRFVVIDMPAITTEGLIKLLKREFPSLCRLYHPRRLRSTGAGRGGLRCGAGRPRLRRGQSLSPPLLFTYAEGPGCPFGQPGPFSSGSNVHAGDRFHLSVVGALPEPADDLIQRLLPDKVAAVLKDLRHPALLVRGGLSPGLHLTDNGAGHGLHHHAIEKAQLLRRVAALEIEQPPAAVAVSPVDPGLGPEVAVPLRRDPHNGCPPDGIAVHGALEALHRAGHQPAHVEDLLAPPQALSGLLQAVCRHAGPFRQHLGIPLGVPGLGCVDDGFHRFPSLWNGGGRRIHGFIIYAFRPGGKDLFRRRGFSGLSRPRLS